MLRVLSAALLARAPAASALRSAAGEAAAGAAPRWTPGGSHAFHALPLAARPLLAPAQQPRAVASALSVSQRHVWRTLRTLHTAHCAAAEGAASLPSPPVRSRTRKTGRAVRAADLPTPPGDGAGGHAGDAAQAAAGAVLGFCTGYALKQAGRTLALLVGFGFLSAQLASAAGVAPPATHAALSLAWRSLRKASGLPRDANLRLPSPAKLAARCHAMLETHAAAAAGFAPGLYLGLRC